LAKIIAECIPNFSEGRNEKIISALVREASSVPGAALLDFSSDPSHNRSVCTLLGQLESLGEAAFRLCRLASELIDLNCHAGEHPRMGATDVIPFIPVKGAGMAECIEMSKAVASRIWNELKIPVFLYELSASCPDRKDLSNVRKGQFEGMPKKLLEPSWAPDFGKREIHSTAGVTAVGARMPLIAYNINLSTSDLSIAKAIAKAVRGSSGGYAFCKAIGIMLTERNTAQVSMNMVNFEATPLYRVQEAVRAEAKRWGVSIIGSELIGLSPSKALLDVAAYYLQIENFDSEKQIIENRLLQME
jgi:glutamate formiminotransferase